MKRTPEETIEGSLKKPRESFPHAFKCLAPDALTSAILGVKGAGVQEMQQQTDARISIADRADMYANTNSRLVLVRANTPQSIDLALAAIVEKLKSVVENPRSGVPMADPSEMFSKTGEVKIRCVVPRAVAGAVIGPKGANVAELRAQTGSRVRVEDGIIGFGDTAEQVISLLGSFDALFSCLSKINGLVQELAQQSWFPDWAHLNVNNNVLIGTGFGKGGNGMAQIPGLPGMPQMMGDPMQQQVGFPMAGGFPQMGQQLMIGGYDDDIVSRTYRSLPRHLFDQRTFAMQVSLPIESMSGLIGKGGSGTKEIFEKTGAKVTLRDDDPNTTVTLEGQLASLLGGYMLLMKRYLELEPHFNVAHG